MTEKQRRLCPEETLHLISSREFRRCVESSTLRFDLFQPLNSAHRPPPREKKTCSLTSAYHPPAARSPPQTRRELLILEVNPSTSANSLRTRQTNHVGPSRWRTEAIKSTPNPSAKYAASAVIVYGGGRRRGGACVFSLQGLAAEARRRRASQYAA